MRRRATVAAFGLLAASALAGPPGTPAAAVPVPEDCKIQPGGSSVDPWAQQRVGIQQAWTVTRGRDVDTGAPIRVAVIDSGLSLRHPQLAGVQHAAARTAIAHDPLRGITDCGGHGTQVTAIIAAQLRPGAAFYGVAPDVEILPIKVSNGKTGSLAAVVTAIDLAIAEHAQVVNMSLGVKSDAPALRAAVQRAAEHGVLIVAAAGNDQQQDNLPQYPAAYSTRFDNVIAVSATDSKDSVGTFSETGNYVDVAAPGVQVQTVGALGGYRRESGTSFATPFVTGTAALVLAANPGLGPGRVRDRIEATADPPPASVPDPRYGWGIVDPYLAVTSVSDRAASSAPAPARPLPARAVPRPPDRSLQHAALATGAILLGLMALALTAAAVLRGRRPAGTGPTALQHAAR